MTPAIPSRRRAGSESKRTRPSSYRARYAEFLKIDFPRISLPRDRALFQALARLDAEPVALHLLRAPALAQGSVTHPVACDSVVEPGSPKYLARGQTLARGRVYISKADIKQGTQAQYFEGVSTEVWAFMVGRYQVCHKWLKDRKGRALSYDDLTHYGRIVAALGETITGMALVDAAIEEGGGWPLA